MLLFLDMIDDVIEAHGYSMRYKFTIISIHVPLNVSWQDFSTTEVFVSYKTQFCNWLKHLTN